MKILIKVLTIILFNINFCYAKESLESKFHNYIQELEKIYQCRIGISAYNISNKRTFEYKSKEKFHMASVVKIPLFTYLAHLEDKKDLNFDEEIIVSNKDLTPGSGSLFYYTKWHPIKISIKNLIESMLVISDNSATDLLFERVGGPFRVNEYITSLGFKEMNISRDIYELFLNSNGMKDSSLYKKHSLEKYSQTKSQLEIEDQKKYHDLFHSNDNDTTTPLAMTFLLKKLINKEILSDKNTELFLDILSRCATSQKRIKRFLTSTFKTSDKTGTWFYSVNPKYTYANDVGIITIPHLKEKIIISIFVDSDKFVKVKMLDEVIALITKTIIDSIYFTN